MRIVFVNLHGNEFLVKTLNKIIFHQSVAVKHQYLLQYLLSRDDIEVCSYVNPRGLSMSYTTQSRLLQSFRFREHRIALRKNGIDPRKITLLRHETDIRHDDIVILYQYYLPQFEFQQRPDAFIAVSMIHFGIHAADAVKRIAPDAVFNESRIDKYSLPFQHYYPGFSKPFLLQPFVFGERFKITKPFAQRKCKAVAVGTITYPDYIQPFYGTNCIQPARKQIKDHAAELQPFIDCFSSDYLEDDDSETILPSDNPITKVRKRLHNKFFTGHQKKYYSFDMVEKYNDYKMCIIGEEITGIPGIGFAEGMANGCAYIGQTVGYYEDYGMRSGVHYIGYDGTLADLQAKIAYYQAPEHQAELEQIARNGYDFARTHFRGPAAAQHLIDALIKQQQQWLKAHPQK